MNENSMDLAFITLAVLGICAVYGNFWARRFRDFLRIARNRERLVDLAKEIGSENIDEMLVAIPGGE